MAFEPAREGQLTERELKWSRWWVNNRHAVRRAGVAVFAIAAFSLLAYGLFGFLDYYFLSGVRERANLAQQAQPYINYVFHRERHRAEALMVESPVVVAGGDGRYDFVALATNPNEEWVARFSYHYVSDGVMTAEREVFLLPGDSLWLDVLGVRSDSRPGQPALEMSAVNWDRVDWHLTRPDYEVWLKERLALEVGESSFLPPDPGDPLATSRARFYLTNATAFSYRELPMTVTLWSGSRLVGINRIVISRLLSGERRMVEAVWFHEVPGVTAVEVDPQLDVFDDSLYLPPGA
jgi:hypothetical protein